MTKYYIIVASGLTDEQESLLAQRWSKYGWWHAVPSCWLLHDSDQQSTAVDLRDEIQTIAPLARILVMQADPKTWAGTAMTESNREWLTKYWPPEGA